MWEILGIPPTADLGTIKSAYAERLKICHPEEDPEGFQRLYTAYQQATRCARQAGRQPAAEQPPVPVTPALPVDEAAEIKRGTAEVETARALAEYLTLLQLQEREVSPAPEPPEGTQAPLDFSALISRGLEMSQVRELQAALAELEAVTGDPVRRESPREWSAWMESPLLQRVMDQEDFITELCRVLTGWDDLPDSLYRDLFAAYGFYGEISWLKDSVYEPLYRILYSEKSHSDEAREKQRLRIRKRNNQIIALLCLVFLMAGVLIIISGNGSFFVQISVFPVLIILYIRAALNRAPRLSGPMAERDPRSLRLRR